VPASLAEHYVNTTESFAEKTNGRKRRRRRATRHCSIRIASTRSSAAYTPEMVERTTGCPRDVFVKIAEALARNSGRERTGTICYAVGWTHHTTGFQMIRAAAIIQGLLGNVGRPAAAYWRCVGIPAFKAAPISRPYTICCRPICPSRTHLSRARH
jgi:formate dehydrogenase major subunit